MDSKRIEELKNSWYQEEKIAHIHGWDFSHINDRYTEENNIPWDYYSIIKKYLKPDMVMLDYDTGGGEFLLTLNHPYHNTKATEGYEPNVKLCEEKLLPLGIDFKACDDPKNIPFADETFDIVINRHGSFDQKELYRILKKGGLFITQQVGAKNDRDLVLKVLPNTPVPFPDMMLDIQVEKFKELGFQIIKSDEAYDSIRFFDIGAFVWFSHIIEWEFIDFSVDKCLDKLIKMQEEIDEKGYIEGTTHRYLIVAKK